MVQGMTAGVTIPAIPTIWEVTMTSATTTPSRGARGRSAEGQGYGLVVFAVALLDVIGSLRTWGWITLIIGGLQVLAAVGVMGGNQMARWFGVAVLGLNAIDQMFFIPAYPFWSLTIIAMDIVALWGLCAYGSRENLAA